MMLNNKKGQIGTGVIIAIAVGLVILIVGITLGFSLIFSKGFIFYLLGGGLIALSIIYVVPAALNSDLTNKKIGLVFGLFGVGLVLILIPMLGLSQTMLVGSISNVDVENGGSKVLVTASTGGGQALSITFSPNVINSYIQSEGYQATKTSTLTAEYLSQQLKYNFVPDSNSRIMLVKDSGSVTTLPFINSLTTCKNKYPNSIAAVITSAFTAHCWETYANGEIEYFIGGQQNAYTIRFNLDGQTADLTQSSSSITLPGAVINFGGNLLENNIVNKPDGRIFHVDTSWYLLAPDAYSNVNTAYNTFLQTLVSDAVGGALTQTQFDTAKAIYYEKVNNNIDPRDDLYISSNSNIQSVSFSEGVMSVNLKQPVFKPTFTILLDATKVGIIQLTGVPKINSCINSQMFEQAGSKSVSASISNIGTQEGTFDFSVTCDNPQMSGSANSLDFSAGSTKTVNFQLNGGNTGTSTNTGTCTLKVTDKSSQKSVSCSFGVSVKYYSAITECIPGTTQCSGDGKSAMTCNDDGNWETTQCVNNCGPLSSGFGCLIVPCTENCGEDEQTACEAKAVTNPLAGYTWVETTTQPSTLTKIFTLGFAKPTTTAYCKAAYIPYYILGSVIIVLAVLITLLLRKPAIKSSLKKK